MKDDRLINDIVSAACEVFGKRRIDLVFDNKNPYNQERLALVHTLSVTQLSIDDIAKYMLVREDTIYTMINKANALLQSSGTKFYSLVNNLRKEIGMSLVKDLSQKARMMRKSNKLTKRLFGFEYTMEDNDMIELHGAASNEYMKKMCKIGIPPVKPGFIRKREAYWQNQYK